MHYVVCVKQVPDTTEVKIDPETNTLIRQGVPSIMNPYDVNAVEAAVQLKEEYGGKVTVLTMGPPAAKEVLKKAVAIGADEAILITDRAFAGADTLATGYALTAALKKVNEQDKIDLILCGKQAIDGDTAQVGPGIASRFEIPQLTYVMEIKEIVNNQITVFRKVKAGKELSKTTLPALVTVIPDINDVRYASLDNLIKAARFDYKTWTKDDLDADIESLGLKGSATMVRNIFAPPKRGKGEMIPGGEGNGEKAIETLLDKLIPLDIIPN